MSPVRTGTKEHANTEQDVLGPLKILWKRMWKNIERNPIMLKWIEEEANDSFESFDQVVSLDQDDTKRCILMDPKR